MYCINSFPAIYRPAKPTSKTTILHSPCVYPMDAANAFRALLLSVGVGPVQLDSAVAEALRIYMNPPRAAPALPTSSLSKFLKVFFCTVCITAFALLISKTFNYRRLNLVWHWNLENK